MKIAVLGGGTAGFVAAAHATRHLPQAELLHIFDSRIPTIGVGEGTTPRFPVWFEEVTGLGFPALEARCRATLKRGVRFENWGARTPVFVNRFHPTRLFGYHFDASELVGVLAEHVRGERIDARVEAAETTAEGVRISLEDGTAHRCDYVFDARGFPRAAGAAGSGEPLVRADWIPTGRAMVRWLPPSDLIDATRAVARPHGWIFQIPLRGSTSCGYIFNRATSSDAEVDADFTAFLHAEGVSGWTERGMLDFPNYIHHEVGDGRIFRIGNAASFLEPLEATSICTAIVEMRAATQLIIEHGSEAGVGPAETASFNTSMLTYILRNSLFLTWHYSAGSLWDTAFWRYARQGLERARQCALTRPHLADMAHFEEAGRILPGAALSAYEDRGQEHWNEEVYPLLTLYRPFGNFSEINFAQVGHGIGRYDQPRTECRGDAVAAQVKRV